MVVVDDGGGRGWALEEFGHAELGDFRLVDRAVAMATRLAEAPAGRITQVYRDEGEREGAFRLVRNHRLDSEKLGRASVLAALERCRPSPFMFVPTDGSSLTLKDPLRVRGLGPIGPRSKRARGLKVMSSIAVAPDGTPQGLLGQVWWARSDRPARKPTAKRKLKEKETRHWLGLGDSAIEMARAAGYSGRLWFQWDREGDFQEGLLWAVDQPDHWLTVRANRDRRVVGPGKQHLWETVEGTPRLGRYEVDVAEGPNRRARRARMVLRARPVTLVLTHPWTKTKRQVTLNAVLARESRKTVPRGERPLVWMLLTTHPIDSFEDARLVVFGYTMRWRIEDFHKTWKSVCRIEETQLRDADHIVRWGRLSAAVAMRIERLKHLARTAPDAPATTEFSDAEIKAVVMLRGPKTYDQHRAPTIAELVLWVAQLGGYTGKSSGGPPGNITLSRGLAYVGPAALVLAKLANRQAKK